jgi:recombination protein RecA
MAPPFKEVEFDILYGQGISKEGDLVDLASEANVVDKSGAWFSFNGERIGQGRENAKQFLIDHPEVAQAIEGKLLAHFNVRRIGVEDATAVAAVEATDAAGDKSKGTVRPVAAAPIPNGKRPNA